MTTKEAAARYEHEHLAMWHGRPCAVFNPQEKPCQDLPVIYGFNNGGSLGMMSAVLIAEDGTGLGSHCCSSEGYMPHDLGVLEGSRPDRHENDFQKHYPDGYRMEFVGYEGVAGHEKLQAAFALRAKAVEES